MIDGLIIYCLLIFYTVSNFCLSHSWVVFFHLIRAITCSWDWRNLFQKWPEMFMDPKMEFYLKFDILLPHHFLLIKTFGFYHWHFEEVRLQKDIPLASYNQRADPHFLKRHQDPLK
jgi:hypothetical protein